MADPVRKQIPKHRQGLDKTCDLLYESVENSNGCFSVTSGYTYPDFWAFELRYHFTHLPLVPIGMETPRKDLAMRPTQERREHPRKSCSPTVKVLAWDSAFKAYAKNVSLGGMFIETPYAFSAGEKIVLVFTPPGQDEPIMVNTQEFSAGFDFCRSCM